MDAHPPLDQDRLREALVRQGPYAAVEVVAEIDSTNAELLRRAGAGASAPAHLSALLAEHQTEGRGRLHPLESRPRPWLAPPRSSLTASVMVRPPPQAPAPLTLLSLAFALAAAEALDLVLPGQAVLKWPNDVMVADRKIAGVLAGATAERQVVVGIGLNVHQTAAQLPDERAISLALAGVPGADRTWLAVAVLSAAASWCERWARGDAKLLAALRARMATLGREAQVELPDGRIVTGAAEALEADGSLRLRRRGGQTILVSAGEVM
ncbi:MAG: biotin--[acetyl-CoA-carboxylase] ligase [Bifidobacteriaceae bacterium]|jgi:BirA family biotin operon repressor/biotin-[acetyl-CoA-carboxylase] ligase|nr:biotin--[acetyl-CoA-carboxylase] ligase [Bifidobacteriaceae bacterium]